MLNIDQPFQFDHFDRGHPVDNNIIKHKQSPNTIFSMYLITIVLLVVLLEF
jgi:hypothetical protein